jgi:hypothetical protein
MIKVLDLFSGTQSMLKAFLLMGLKRGIDFEYYGIDIYSPEGENIILDLSQDDIVNKVVEVLPKGFNPDFIWVSPPCNKFSTAAAIKGGNLYFEITKQGVKVRENFEPLKNSIYKNSDQDKIKEDAHFSIKLVSNIQKIIDYYDCDFVIENPQTSYIKNFLNPLYVMNNTNYCMYGFDYKKSTNIFSKYVLDLKQCNHEYHGRKIGSRTTLKEYGANQKKVTSYAEKASVPPKLIVEILSKMLGGNQ